MNISAVHYLQHFLVPNSSRVQDYISSCRFQWRHELLKSPLVRKHQEYIASQTLSQVHTQPSTFTIVIEFHDLQSVTGLLASLELKALITDPDCWNLTSPHHLEAHRTLYLAWNSSHAQESRSQSQSRIFTLRGLQFLNTGSLPLDTFEIYEYRLENLVL